MHSIYWVSDASDLQRNGQIFSDDKGFGRFFLLSSHRHLRHRTLQLLHRNSSTCVLTATVHSGGGGGGYHVGSAITLASYWTQVFGQTGGAFWIEKVLLSNQAIIDSLKNSYLKMSLRMSGWLVMPKQWWQSLCSQLSQCHDIPTTSTTKYKGRTLGHNPPTMFNELTE